jgi:hypothetical protein
MARMSGLQRLRDHQRDPLPLGRLFAQPASSLKRTKTYRIPDCFAVLNFDPIVASGLPRTLDEQPKPESPGVTQC